MDVRSSLLLVFLAATPLLCQNQHHTPIKSTYAPATPIGDHPPVPFQATMPMPSVAPLFLQGNGFSSTLVLINNSVASTYADVTVRGLDGSTLVSRRVNFDPHSELRIELANLLKNNVATSGSILIMQSSALAGPSIAGAVTMTYSGSGTPNYVDEELSMPDEKGSESLQGVVDRANGPPVLAISSVAESAQNVTVECFGEKGPVAVAQQIALAAGQTTIVNACSGPEHETTDPLTSLINQAQDTNYGSRGLKLTSDGMAGGFVAFALAPHQAKGDQFFSSILFADPAEVYSSNTVFTGIPVGSAPLLPDGTYTPRISMTNFSTTAVHVHTRFATTSSDNPLTKEVGTLTIPPKQSRELVLDALQGDPTLQNSFIVYSDGAPGALMAKLVSTSDSQLHEVELQAKDASDVLNAGNHPWTVDGATNSTLLLFNHSSTPENFDVSIFGGTYTWQKTYKLAPMATLAVDIRKLIDDQVKDDSGNLLPKAAERGEINWMDVNPTRGSGRLLETDRSTAKARNFSCGYSGLLCGSTFDQYLEYMASGSIVDFASIIPITCTSGTQNACSGQQTGTGGSFSISWSSGTPSVASVSGASTNPSVNLLGVSHGSSTISGQVRSQYCMSGGGGSANVTNIFSISYSAYIPVDHVQVALDGCSYNGNAVDYIYMGDGNRGTSRTYESLNLVPSASTSSAFSATCGQTKQYAYGSPANGSTLSSLDEDGIANDCHLWNGAATAPSSGFTHTETYSGTQAQELFIGSAGNPLEPAGVNITWNMNTLINVSNPSSPTATVNYNHTCYPAHQVVVNGATVYSYTPPSNSFAYIAVCLAGTNKVIGQTTPVAVPVQ